MTLNKHPIIHIRVHFLQTVIRLAYDNGMVSKWMSEDKKDLPDNLTQNDGIPVFLLMKQAISTGWDCPRAKILVKLRENMSESFEIPRYCV